MAIDRTAAFPIGASITLDELAGDPHPALARLRRREPVSWVPALGGWLVTGRAAAVEVQRDATTFTVDDPRFSTAQVIGPSMLSTDGSEHARHREPFTPPFRQAAVRDRFGEWIAGDARRLVAALAPVGEGDLTAGLAAPLAAGVMRRTLGLAGATIGEMLGWYDAIVAAVDAITEGRAPGNEGAAAYRALAAALRPAMSGGDTVLSLAASAGTLTEEEVAANAAVLLFGGIVTVEGAIAAALWRLLSHPDQLEMVRADRSLVAGAVEESLRLEPAAAVVDRYATRDVRLGGAPIGESDLVRVSLAGANRDPVTFPDPDRFDVRRGNAAQHLAFARGPHACLGIHLARLEAAAAVDAVLDLLVDIRLDAAVSLPPAGLVFRKPERVAGVWG